MVDVLGMDYTVKDESDLNDMHPALSRCFLVALMINFEEKPGRSLHMISCHHHTRFSSSNTATECLFVCLVCKSKNRSHSSMQEDTQSYQSLQILQ